MWLHGALKLVDPKTADSILRLESNIIHSGPPVLILCSAQKYLQFVLLSIILSRYAAVVAVKLHAFVTLKHRTLPSSKKHSCFAFAGRRFKIWAQMSSTLPEVAGKSHAIRHGRHSENRLSLLFSTESR